VSRWWPETRQLFVLPHVARLQGCGDQTPILPVTASPAAAPYWQAAVDTAIELAGKHLRRHSRLRVVIADHYVRYALLPWSDRLLGEQLRRTTAVALMRSNHGDIASTLNIALDQPRFGMNGIAAGIDGTLLAELRARLAALGIRPHSIVPRALHELALARTQLASGNGWFCHAEKDRIVLAGLHGGNIVSLRNQRTDAVDRQALASELGGLTAAATASGQAGSTKLYFSADGLVAPEISGLETIRLGRSPQ
jgi:hypothetical protein